MKKTASFILVFLALVMFFLSWKINGLPPAVTGIGFLVIAWVFYKDKD